jgi:hypothetical protein
MDRRVLACAPSRHGIYFNPLIPVEMIGLVFCAAW